MRLGVSGNLMAASTLEANPRSLPVRASQSAAPSLRRARLCKSVPGPRAWVTPVETGKATRQEGKDRVG